MSSVALIEYPRFLHVVGPTLGKLRRVDSVTEVQPKIRQIGRPRRSHFRIPGPHSGQRASYFRIVGGSQPSHIFTTRQRRRRPRLLGEKRSPRVRKQKHCELQPRLVRRQFAVAQIALTLLLLQLSLHYIGMCAFTRSFAFLRQISERLRFSKGLFQHMLFGFRSRNRVVQADHTQNESPARNFQFRGSTRRIGGRNLRIGELLQPDGLINGSLTDVFVNCIVRDKDRGCLCPTLDDLVGLSVRLRVEHLVVIHDGGQQGSLAKITIDGRRFLGR